MEHFEGGDIHDAEHVEDFFDGVGVVAHCYEKVTGREGRDGEGHTHPWRMILPVQVPGCWNGCE